MVTHRETNTTLTSVKSLYRLALQGCAKLDWIGPLGVRLIIGFALVVDGTRKLGNLENVAKFFANDLHMIHPHTDAGFFSVVELVAGLLLVSGGGPISIDHRIARREARRLPDENIL